MNESPISLLAIYIPHLQKSPIICENLQVNAIFSIKSCTFAEK